MSKNIIITIPSKIDWEDYQKELKDVEDRNLILNFKVSNFPKETNIGNKCYSVYKGFIIGWMEIVGMSEGNITCETTGKKWEGKFIQRSGKFNYIEPIPMTGFQGFRYFDF